MEQNINQKLDDDVKNFLTLEDEKIITCKRQHWLVIIPPVSLIILTALFSILLIVFLFIYLLQSFVLLISLTLLISAVTMTLITKTAIDWQHHIYIITNRKIMEIICAPLFSDNINDVFLDQVRTTEVVSKIGSILGEIFNIGDVTIAFDRPSKEEVFILKNISNPQETSIQISNGLKTVMHEGPQIWFQKGESLNQFKYNEDVFDKREVTAN